MGRSGDPCVGLFGTPCMGKFSPHGDSKDEHTRPLPLGRSRGNVVSQQGRWSRERAGERSDVPMGLLREV